MAADGEPCRLVDDYDAGRCVQPRPDGLREEGYHETNDQTLWLVDEHGWHDDVDHELRGNATRCRGHSSGGQAAVIRRTGEPLGRLELLLRCLLYLAGQAVRARHENGSCERRSRRFDGKRRRVGVADPALLPHGLLVVRASSARAEDSGHGQRAGGMEEVVAEVRAEDEKPSVGTSGLLPASAAGRCR